MRTYLLTWNPKEFPWGSVEKEINANLGSEQAPRWSVGKTRRRIESGDRFFMIRLGAEPRGIVARGTFASGPYEAPHWKLDRKEKGDTALYAEIKLDSRIGDPLILRSELDEPRFLGVKWSSQSSGIEIRADIADELDREWDRRVSGGVSAIAAFAPTDITASVGGLPITRFFEEILLAKVRNPQWSWGAVDPASGHLFLRVWKDQLSTIDGIEHVEVFWRERKTQSPGLAERRRHLDTFGHGGEVFGVLCTAIDPRATPRRIKDFDRVMLLRLGVLVERGSKVYASIVGRVAVSGLANDALLADVNAITREHLDETTKVALVNARLGQGQFRKQVLVRWQSRCCVTGAGTLAAIRASHIKPWRHSTNEERLDPENGLPMIATLDALFDRGLVSFAEDGAMLVSKQLADVEQRILGLLGVRLTRAMSGGTRAYIKHHREIVFEGKERAR